MLQIYNTLTRKKEEFKPITQGQVKMYVCGITVYDYCHLGHARALITFDLIYRALEYLGYQVNFVRNFTDIDDKIINRAKEQGIAWNELAQNFINAFHEDAQALQLKAPSLEPKATDHISEMIEIIKNLEKQDLAYKAGSDVFFAVRKFSQYGKLSGKNIDDLESGARVDVMESKNDPLDFALWKGSKPGEPFWPSPWGEGRPGWHIECSAMSMKYLSETFDIHGGGRDLIFPHHENEIAQSEGCTHKTLANYWVHNGFVNINSEKMSKSLNNFLSIREILKQYPAEAVRLFILSSHYRSPLDYTDQNIANALSGLERYYTTKRRLELFCQHPPKAQTAMDSELLQKVQQLEVDFKESIEDDFNSAKVVGSIYEFLPIWNKALDENRGSLEAVQLFLKVIDKISQVMDIFGSSAEVFLSDHKTKGLQNLEGISEEKINELIQARREAKKNKDFKKSDAIRDELKSLGIQLKDNPDGTTNWSLL